MMLVVIGVLTILSTSSKYILVELEDSVEDNTEPEIGGKFDAHDLTFCINH